MLAETLNNCDVYVSFITELELLGYRGITHEEHNKVKDFLNDCIIIDLNESIKLLTIELKQSLRLKLPDAIIAATALVHQLDLISHNTSDFNNINGLTVIDPYSI